VKQQMLSLEDIQQLHRDGQLSEAKSAYLDFIEKHEDNVQALHYLGILYAEEGDFDQGEKYLLKAYSLSQQDLSLQLHLANIYKAQKKYNQAIELLQDIIQKNPEFAAAYNNLGTVYHADKKYKEAILAYHTAIKIQPDYVDAYYNLGLALQKSGRGKEAMNTYKAVLELSASHQGARFQLGRLFMQIQEYQDAISQFRQIEEEFPAHFETQVNLATSFLKLGWVNEAKKHYQQALNIRPDDIQILFNLGVIAMQQGNITEAIDYYTRVLGIDANSYEAHNNLGVAFLSLKNREKALFHFRHAVRIDAQDIALKHTIDILLQDKQIDVSPPEYIRSLFNSYADHFDAHVVDTLHYDVPGKMFDLVNQHTDVLHGSLNILDLGCGTGLCGELFHSKTNTLTGVDLSGGMLKEAEQKKIYQQLIEADISDFLKGKHHEYDLILAGDVLVYLGELGGLFAEIHQALRENGMFVFNAEISENKDYQMTASGRFAHTKTYLDSVISKTHFKILEYQAIQLRLQNDKPVQGHLYLLGV